MGYAFDRTLYQGDGVYLRGYETDGETTDLDDGAYVSVMLKLVKRRGMGSRKP